MTRLLPMLFALSLAVLVACSERDGVRDATTGTSSGGGELEQMAAAMQRAGTYRLAVNQANLVLPRWGGSDGGTVLVDLRSGDAYGELFRTGDGTYEVVLRDGETYFKRETCPTWAKIQDGAGVLAAFVITAEEMRGSRALGAGEYELQGLGRVRIEVDAGTGLPREIRSDTLTNNGQPLVWRFSEWGETFRSPQPETDRLRGPGGNPC